MSISKVSLSQPPPVAGTHLGEVLLNQHLGEERVHLGAGGAGGSLYVETKGPHRCFDFFSYTLFSVSR